MSKLTDELIGHWIEGGERFEMRGDGGGLGSKPFPVEIDFSTYMTVAPVVAGDCRHQGALR